MAFKDAKLGYLGIIFGGTGLLLFLVHLWAGPFSPKPSLETYVNEKADSLRKAFLDGLKGKKTESEAVSPKWDADRVTELSVAVLGGIACLLAVLSFAAHEPWRVSGGAIALGGGAIAIQFLLIYVIGFLALLLILSFIFQGGF